MTRTIRQTLRGAVLLAMSLGIAPLQGASAVAGTISLSSLTNTISTGSAVAGCSCSLAGPLFVTSGDLGSALTHVKQAIKSVGQALNTGQMQQLQAQKTLDNQFLQEEVHAREELKAAQMAEGLTASVSPQFAASNAPMIQGCNAAAGIGGLGTGLSNARNAGSGFASALSEYDNGVTSGHAAVARMAQQAGASLSSVSLFSPAGDNASADQTAQFIANLTDPVPAPQMTKAMEAVPAGITAMANQHAVEAKLSASQGALATIAAWNHPDIPASDIQEMTGAPVPQTDIRNGNVSENDALQQMVNARYANPKWYSHLAGEGQVGAVKTMVQMEAVRLALHEQMLRMDEHLAQVSASAYAKESVDPATNQLNQLAGQSMSESNGSLKGQP